MSEMAATMQSSAIPSEFAPDRRLEARRASILKLVSYGSPIALILLWETVVRAGTLSSQILPAPSAVLISAWRLVLTGELPTNLAVSFLRAMAGLIIGLTLGLLLGIMVGLSKWADAILDRPLQMVRAVPFFAILPLLIIWFGVGEEGKIFLIATAVLFPIYLNTVLGIRQVDPKLLELARAARMSRTQTIWDIVLPGALPSILNGFRMAITVSWLALIVGETIGARSGLGFMAADAREYLRTDVIVLTVVIYALIGIISDAIARFLEATLLRWHPTYAKR